MFRIHFFGIGTFAFILTASYECEFTEYEISKDAERFAEIIERSKSGRTVPQIFIGDTHIGGRTELENIDKLGGIDPLLAPILE